MPSHFSHVQLLTTSWTVVCQAPLTMGFSRQEHWNGLSCLPPEDFPTQGSNPHLLCLSALAGGFFTTSASWESECRIALSKDAEGVLTDTC